MPSAWGAGIATYAGEKVLEVFYPEPRLETAPGEPLAFEPTSDALRGTTQRALLTVIEDLQQPPSDAADAYLRLHLLSHRLVKPREINMDGIFGALPNVAWTSAGPVDPADLTAVQLKARQDGASLQVFSLDKFPRMTDYVPPPGVRIAAADRVRLGS